jgi:hypothetical protein
MGIVKKLMTGAAALSLAAVPVAAQAANAAKLSLSQDVRAGKSVKSAEQARGGFIIPLIAVVAVILGIIAIADSDDSPNSP